MTHKKCTMGMFGKGNPLVLFQWVISCSVFQKYKKWVEFLKK